MQRKNYQVSAKSFVHLGRFLNSCLLNKNHRDIFIELHHLLLSNYCAFDQIIEHQKGAKKSLAKCEVIISSSRLFTLGLSFQKLIS
jgi:hypothetical protein